VGEVHRRLEDGELELAELVEALATPVLQAA
jgi:hypothetical protein